MSGLAVDHPWTLALALLAALPFLVRILRRSGHPRIETLPDDPLSTVIDLAIRAAGAAAILLLTAALAGLHLGGGSIERTGIGSHLVLLIDRSASMDNTFANSRPGAEEESKSDAARRLLLDFLDRPAQDRVGVAAFSTSPMLFLPMTEHSAAVRGAVSGIDEFGLSQTNVGRGLAMAFSMFDDERVHPSRAVLLVSDGAGLISPEVRETLRAEALAKTVNIYWLYLRTSGSPGIFEPIAQDQIGKPQLRPERHLHLFLQDLGVPYRAFEAENPAAVAEAIDEIGKLEAQPLVYSEPIPRRDLAPYGYLGATFCIMLLVLSRLIERPLTRSQPGALVVRHRGAP